MTYEELINDFLEKEEDYAPLLQKDVIEWLLDSPNEFSRPCSERVFKECWEEKRQNNIQPHKFEDNARKSVQGSKKSKDGGIAVYKKLWEFYCAHFSNGSEYLDWVRFPEITWCDKTETLVYILKSLQGERPGFPLSRTQKRLSDDLWCTEKLIKDYIGEIKCKDKKLEILGAEIDIGLKTTNRMLTPESTCSPVFLPLNITQAATLLYGLAYSEKTGKYSTASELLAKDIWCQLSDYARKRIKEKFPNDLIGWLNRLQTEHKVVFQNEKDMLCHNQEEQGLYNEKYPHRG